MIDGVFTIFKVCGTWYLLKQEVVVLLKEISQCSLIAYHAEAKNGKGKGRGDAISPKGTVRGMDGRRFSLQAHFLNSRETENDSCAIAHR